MTKLTFCGGAKSVTGANYLLETDKASIVVDCGLFQGSRFAEAKNFDPFLYDPSKVDAVLLTHAHADHVGRLPKLVADGFRGRVFATPPSAQLAELILEDAFHVLEKEVELFGGKPFYHLDDLWALHEHWQPVEYGEAAYVAPGLRAVFRDAGHMLGSASITVQFDEKITVVFSGDLGNAPAPLLKSPEPLLRADFLVIESVYGDRRHDDRHSRSRQFERVVRETIHRGGVLMIPVFAVERTQELLFELNDLVEGGRIPRVPVFLDSPLAIRATEVYRRYPQYFNEEASGQVRAGDDLFRFPGLKFALTKEESKRINDVPAPKIILAGAGMTQGGRIHHHLIRYLPDSQSTFLSVGYSVPGTIARKLLEGETEIELRQARVQVRARIEAIPAYSGHADRSALIKWIEPMAASLRRVFVVQGEAHASEALAHAINERFGLEAVVPNEGEFVEL
ncbi:MBL fold metallo-hydrolase [Candidatus Parcubacteria bacterium]|nr:MBL fold metallo-hydrolase [Candidatus Parcubacteria bacterium]